MKKNRYFQIGIALTAMTCMAVSCTNDDEFADEQQGRQTLTLDIIPEQWMKTEPATRASYSSLSESSGNKTFAVSFTSGDAIGLFIVDKTGEVIVANQKYTYSGSAWSTDSPMQYVTGLKDYSFFAYYPWVATLSGAPAVGSTPDISSADAFFSAAVMAWTPAADQSTVAKFTGADLMIAKGTTSVPMFHEVNVAFTMAHQMGLLVTQPDLTFYDINNPEYTWTVTQEFTTNIPYALNSNYYYIAKPNVATTLGAKTATVGARQVEQLNFTNMEPEEIRYNGENMILPLSSLTIPSTATYTYSVSTNQGNTWGSYTSTKPSWLTLTPTVVDGHISEYEIAVTNSTSKTVNLGTMNIRNVPGDATLKAASSVSNVDLSMVNNTGGTRASRTTANCYLVHAPGTYRIPLVYGNAINNGTTNSLAYLSNTSTNSNKRDNLINHADANITAPWITASGDGGTNSGMGYTVDGASIVWQDVQNMIKNVSISADGYYLTFEIDKDNIAEGNAVVAATSSGTIVWSWHIWVTSETLSNLTTISTGSHSYQVAPVNVGQINGTIKSGTTVYAGEQCKVRATANGVTVEFLVIAKNYESGGTNYNYPSPYYQWGRKDAQYPNTGAYNESGALQATPTVVTGANSIGTTIKNPGKHYYYSSTYGPYNETKYNYWDINNISTGNVTTKTYKTVYDPCPPGFCVPTGNLYYFMGNSSSRSDSNWNSSNTTKTWVAATYSSNTTGSDLIFPASGCRINSFGSLNYVGSYGYCWSATPGSTSGGRRLGFNSSNWYWNNDNRAGGYPVRPVAEE